MRYSTDVDAWRHRHRDAHAQRDPPAMRRRGADLERTPVASRDDSAAGSNMATGGLGSRTHCCHLPDVNVRAKQTFMRRTAGRVDNCDAWTVTPCDAQRLLNVGEVAPEVPVRTVPMIQTDDTVGWIC